MKHWCLIFICLLGCASPLELKWSGMEIIQAEDGSMLLEDASPAVGCYIISDLLPTDKGKPYSVSVWARCENVINGRTQLYIRTFDRQGNRTGHFSSNSISGSHDWEKLSITIPAGEWPENTAAFRIILQPAAGPAKATGKAWFRNLSGAVPTPPPPLTGRESTGEYVFKYGNILLGNKKLNAFPFERPPKSPRLEIMSADARHSSMVQILTDNDLGDAAQCAVWLDGREAYSELKPIPLKKVSGGYSLDIHDLPVCRKLALVFPGKSLLTFDDVKVSRPVFPEDEWKANWIWFTRERVEMVTVFLRRDFELGKAPVKAMWQCAADDGAVVYFNGHRQCSVDGRFSPPNDDIAPMLYAGRNVITVTVRQGRYAAGFLGELDLYFADGSFQKLVTDKSWKYYPSQKEILASAGKGTRIPVPDDWNSPEYDASALGNCVELGIPPMGGWGAVKYRMNAPRTPMILKTSACSDTLHAGQTYNSSITFRPRTPCKEPTPIRIQLTRGGDTFLEQEIGIAPPHKDEFTMPFCFSLSPFLYPGTYQMRLIISGYQACDISGAPCDVKDVTVLNTRHAVPPEAKIKRDAYGIPTLMINGKQCPSIFSARGPLGLRQHGAQFAKAGLHLYHVYLTPSWPTPDTVSFTRMDSIAENLLSGDPEARFIVKIQLRDGKPSWWLDRYPDEAVTFENGAKASHISLASRHWKEFVGEYLRGLIRHVGESPYADRCIGYIASEGEEGQWMHYWGGSDPAAPGTLSDYSPVMLDYFRKWLKRQYRTDAALQKAWNDRSVTLETAAIPTRRERTAGNMQFRDLPLQRKAADYGWALSDVVSEGIVYYAKIIKEATNGKALTGALYGHLMDLGTGFLGEQAGYARQRLPVETPYVDYYLGPLSYSRRFRDIGYPGSYDMPSPGSLELHGKIWLNENDLRSHLHFPAEYAYSVRTPAQFNQQLARELIKAICGRAGFYHFPLGKNGMQWYDDPETIEDLGVLAEIGEKTVTGDRRSTSEIALFFDDDAQCRLSQASRSPFNVNALAVMQREAVYRVGAPADDFNQFDICNPNLKPYKLYIFLNPYHIKDDQLAAIERLAQQPGVAILFASAPGAAGDGGLDTAVAKRLTGMDFVIEDEAKPVLFTTTRPFGEMAAGADFGTGSRQFRPIRPASGYDEVLAVFKGTGMPAVVRRGNIYVSVMPDLPVQILREIAAKANVYVHSQDNIAVYACRQYLGFHSGNERKSCAFRAPGGKTMRQIWPVVPDPPAISEYRWDNREPITRMFEIVP